MLTEDFALPENTLGYWYNGGGLNNQKLALYGLFLKAHREGPPRLVLPDFLVFDIVTYKHVPVPLEQAVRPGPLRDFAARHDIDIQDISPRGDRGGWDYFQYGRDHIPRAALLHELGPDSFTCDFFRSFVPIVKDSDFLQRLADAAFRERGIRLVAQFRIENDWPYHTEHRLKPIVGDSEDNDPSFKVIVEKICNTLVDSTSGIYVACDEGALPIPKNKIRSVVKQSFNIDLFWKSDFLSHADLSQLSPLILSMLDFEMAVAAESFVGLTRSTFSNLAALEKYARSRRPVETHYIYNRTGPKLALRKDNGAFPSPKLAVVADPWAAGRDFDLAQIFQAGGDRERALEHYAACAASDSAERDEVFISLYRAAQIKAQLEFSADVIDTYLHAADVLPARVEALHGASRYCRYHNMFKEGYEIAARGINLAVPAKGLCVEAWIYEWALLDEYAVNAYYAGHYPECIDACVSILERGKIPLHERPRVIGNAQSAIAQVKAAADCTENPAKKIKRINSSSKPYTTKLGGPRIYIVNDLPDRTADPFEGLTQIYAGPAAASAPPGELTDLLREGQALDNRRWSELSAIYKIWQDGPQSDIVGFCHSARYFDFGNARLLNNVNYIGRSEMDSIRCDLFDPDKVLLVNEHTAIVPKELHLNKSVYDQYGVSHNSSDYLLTFKLVLSNYPEIAMHMVAQFYRTTLYAGNQFILSWKDFDELCRLWFSILGKFCDKVSWPREDSYQSRDAGFLAERLFDAWIRFKHDSGHTLIEIPILQV